MYTNGLIEDIPYYTPSCFNNDSIRKFSQIKMKNRKSLFLIINFANWYKRCLAFLFYNCLFCYKYACMQNVFVMINFIY